MFLKPSCRLQYHSAYHDTQIVHTYSNTGRTHARFRVKLHCDIEMQEVLVTSNMFVKSSRLGSHCKSDGPDCLTIWKDIRAPSRSRFVSNFSHFDLRAVKRIQGK
jgi:hypothetical protein